MKEYKVLKEFVARSGEVYSPEGVNTMCVYDNNNVECYAFYQGLRKNGYIKEIHKNGFWSRGVKISIDGPFWKVRSYGDENIERVSNATSHDVEIGLAFRTKNEAEAYADHLRLENELINTAMQKYKAETKYDITHQYIPSITIYNHNFFLYGVYFYAYSDLVDFEQNNAKRMELWASYFVEEDDA